MLVVFLATLAGTIHLFGAIPKDFLPSEDTGRIIAFTEGAQDASFDAMVRNQQRVAAIAMADPNVEAVMSSVGAGGPRPTANSGTMLHPLQAARPARAQRRRTDPEAAPEAVVGPRHQRLSAEPAADPRRRPSQQGRSISTRFRTCDLDVAL